MPSDAVQNFLFHAERSGLLASEAARQELARLTVDAGITTDGVAERLIEKKLLTAFQVEQIGLGRGEECVIAERFHLLEKIGEGGMGAVYRALDTKLDRIVAIKVLPPGRLSDADAVARFQREAKALARLSHPHIIQAYDSGVDRGRHFLVMEFVEGTTLESVLRQHGALSPALAADLIHQAALGLYHAHEKGLVHRDLKPGNLLVSGLSVAPAPSAVFRATASYDPARANVKSIGSTVKLLDLGLARFLHDQIGDSQLTQEGMGMGTPDYMAPEQFRDALHADIRTDIYGLGCTLYHLIAGQVPFPGTSFSEKANAHAKKEPIPLEERCPEVPAGLAVVVQKMMCKHPSERFQNADEVAEALAPFVAGASQSMIRLRQTGRWPPAPLTMRAPPRARPALIWASVVGVALIAIGVAAWPWLFPPDASPLPQPPENKQPGLDLVADADKKKPIELPKPKKVTIPNGLTVAMDGTGQYTSIQAALDAIKPGQTIQIVDSARYDESLSLTESERHAGVTVEGHANSSGLPIIHGFLIRDVAKVTIRRLRIETDKGGMGAQVTGKSPGVLLEGLEIDTGAIQVSCIKIESLGLQPSDAPVVISDCVLRGSYPGVHLAGVKRGTLTPSPVRQVVIKNNFIDRCRWGIYTEGTLENIQIVGNRFSNTGTCGVLFMYPLPPTHHVLIANNTFTQCDRGFIFQTDEGDAYRGENIQIANNLFLNCGSDMDFVVSKAVRYNLDGPGDEQSLVKKWQVGFNAREAEKGALTAKGRIPQCAGDFVQDRLKMVSLDRKSPDYVRLPKDSPLASGGAGGDLPSYMGAVPPDDAPPWDWRWTWESLFNQLLTVSQKSEDRGRFRTIAEALKRAKPGTTIRILDGATYAETLRFDQQELHAGIRLESPEHATLLTSKNISTAVVIDDVPNVHIDGLRFTSSEAVRGTTFVRLRKNAAGAVLTGLDFTTKNVVAGITLDGVVPADSGGPILVSNCTFRVGFDGIMVQGPRSKDSAKQWTSNIRIENNRFLGCLRGIHLDGAVRDLLIAGNIAANCTQEGIGVSDLSSDARGILISNNSVHQCAMGVRVWDDPPHNKVATGQIELIANVCSEASYADIGYVQPGRKGAKGSPTGGNGDDLIAHWLFAKNFRDMSGQNTEYVVPLAKEDRKFDTNEFRSFEWSDTNFLRPGPKSLLATGGAGGLLPPYAGAVPPEGPAAWDWTNAWKARKKSPP